MNKQEIEQNLIFLFIRGSHAYGLNTQTSDFDIGGVCLPNKKLIYGLEKFEQDDIWVDENSEKVDKTVYVLQKIVNMLLENNPNALDFLYAPEHVIKLMTPAWKRFVDIRDEFVSIKCKYSFQGYAYSQLRRLETHRSYLLHPPKKMPLRSDYGLPDVSKFPVTQIETLARVSNDYVKECDRDTFFGEMSQMINREGSLIFKKYVDPDFFLYAIDLFKTGQKEFLHSISSISGKYVKDELVEMAQKELSFMSALDNWKRYEAWKKGRNKKRAEIEEKIGFDCYSDDTEFLTFNGWKSYNDISNEDQLATVYIGETLTNRKHLQLEYQKFTHRFESIYSGEMYHFFGYHIDSLVTPNHRMLYRKFSRNLNKSIGNFILEEAHNLGDSSDFLKTINPITKNYTNKKLIDPDSIPISVRTYLSLMGWLLSDGSFKFKTNKKIGKYVAACVISQKKGNRLQGPMRKFYNKYKDKMSVGYYKYDRVTTKTPNGIQEHVLSVGDKRIVNKLYEDCGHKKEKRIPRYVFSLSKQLKEVLLDSMVRGDGTIKKIAYKSIIYYSSIKELADDVNELAFSCGWESSIYGPYSYEDRPLLKMYQVHINKNTLNTHRIIRNNNIEIIKVVDKKIVCFTVPNQTLVTRRKGHISIHGNSKHASHLRRLENMAHEIVSDKGVLVDRTNIDAQYLMDIKNGNMSFEEIMKDSEEINKKTDAIYKSSKLKSEPNRELIYNTMTEVLDEHFGIGK